MTHPGAFHQLEEELDWLEMAGPAEAGKADPARHRPRRQAGHHIGFRPVIVNGQAGLVFRF